MRLGPWDGPGEVHKEGVYNVEGPEVPWAPWVPTGRKCRELEDTGGKSNEVLEGNHAAVEAYLAYQKGL